MSYAPLPREKGMCAPSGVSALMPMTGMVQPSMGAPNTGILNNTVNNIPYIFQLLTTLNGQKQLIPWYKPSTFTTTPTFTTPVLTPSAPTLPILTGAVTNIYPTTTIPKTQSTTPDVSFVAIQSHEVSASHRNHRSRSRSPRRHVDEPHRSYDHKHEHRRSRSRDNRRCSRNRYSMNEYDRSDYKRSTHRDYDTPRDKNHDRKRDEVDHKYPTHHSRSRSSDRVKNSPSNGERFHSSHTKQRVPSWREILDMYDRFLDYKTTQEDREMMDKLTFTGPTKNGRIYMLNGYLNVLCNKHKDRRDCRECWEKTGTDRRFRSCFRIHSDSDCSLGSNCKNACNDKCDMAHINVSKCRGEDKCFGLFCTYRHTFREKINWLKQSKDELFKSI